MVRKWIRMFKEGRENVHDEEHSERPSLITEELVRCIDKEVDSNRRIVTGKETWICYETPETKRQSLEWGHTGSPKSKKAKPPLSLKNHVHHALGLSRNFVSGLDGTRHSN
ncbi:hypothetical protein AVEN_19710-1 [Araneus ventricosus]|uniref:Mos1 transposase HTH domain-containing protein n=1 Tax=Araneus ventricosus TaxID=182803 RepID=A0A4Y2C2F7_ARAVE|nr:hypothetical protein AVEN_19710-1 [Araneus ventricosus]